VSPAVWVTLAIVVCTASITVGALINRIGNLETLLNSWSGSTKSQGSRIGGVTEEVAYLRGSQDTVLALLRGEALPELERRERTITKPVRLPFRSKNAEGEEQ
jgi:hypothetical protein